MGYNYIARFYDPLVRLVFGSSMMESQRCFLNRVPPSSDVLVVGGGTGRWLNEFLGINPTAKIFYLDESSEMIRLARKGVADDVRITFFQGRHDSISPDQKFDAIILFCFLDLFSTKEIDQVIGGIDKSTKASSVWLVADFMETTWWHSFLLKIMLLFFRVATGLRHDKLPDWQQSLERAGLTVVGRKLFFGNFIASALYQRDVV